MDKMRLRKWILLLCAVMIVPALARAGTQTRQKDASLWQQASEFRASRLALRQDEERKRAELRDWNGPTHNLFARVGRLIESGRYRSREVIKLLGEPDWTFKSGSHHGIRLARGETHLVYWWRGGHDYLYFVIRRGRVARARWWYAGE